MTSSTFDNHEQTVHQTREGILDKLRRFFSIRPSIESLKEKGIYKRKNNKKETFRLLNKVFKLFF